MGTAAARVGIRTRPEPRTHVRQKLEKHLDFWGGDPEPGTPESGSWRNGWPFENFDSRRRGALEIGKIPIEAPVRITTDAPGARVGAFQ